MAFYWLECIQCRSRVPSKEPIYTCPYCRNPLEVQFDIRSIAKLLDRSVWSIRPFGVWRYRELLPVVNPARAVSLHEGGTSLHTSTRLARLLKLRNLFLKNDGRNPTGSFKDRGMTVGITKAVEQHAETVICASTGNTSASLAAYAAKAALQAVVFVPSCGVAKGKLRQAIAHGAKIVRIPGNFDKALTKVKEICERGRDFYLLNSLNPFRLEGQKTVAFEVFEQLNCRAPDYVSVPVGNAGNISAIWKGFKELRSLGWIKRTPRMIGFQASGASPLAAAFKNQSEHLTPERTPRTIASAIRIGNPANWRKALRAVNESHGTIEVVSDREIVLAQRELARMEGLFVEPAAAAAIAGLKKLRGQGEIGRSDSVVAVLTGHGLKDIESVSRL